MRLSIIALGLMMSLSIGNASRVGAQIVSVPTFSVADDAFAVDVAAAYSGLYFLTVPNFFSYEVHLQRTFDQQWDPPYVVNTDGPVGTISLAAVANGGFIAGWMQRDEVVARVLDVLGEPTGTPFQLTADDLFTTGTVRVGGLAAGSAVAWGESGPNVGPRLKAGIAGRFHELESGPLEWDIATTPSGGCVVAWHFFDGALEAVRMQIFDAAGFAMTAPLTLGSSDLTLGAIAASPVNGDMAIVGVLPTTADPYVFEIRAFRFDASGAALGPEVVLGTARSVDSMFATSIVPDAEFDFAGNLYVAWSDRATASRGIYARALDGTGSPLGPAVQLTSDEPRLSVRTARMPDGRFVNAWIADQATWASIVALCAPGGSVCGDGVLNPMCERCDDGPANDDTSPDACRSTCLPAHCGDGATDTGETCDDGNFATCDGCNALCQVEPGVVCGDGVVAPLCGEQCDDADATLLDGCTPACRWERTPGGGGPTTDCLTEWSIDNPTNEPPYDKRGRITAQQRCIDDDPRCDFDGGTPGSCTFHVRACGNNTDVAGCSPPTRLSSWAVDRPSIKQAASRPTLMQVRTTLLGSVPGGIVGPLARDVCSPELPLVVPLRGVPGDYKAAKLTVQTRATSYEGAIDKDKLTLECLPAS